MIKISCRWVIIIIFALFFSACEGVGLFSRPHVATVNGAKIYLDEFQTRLDQKKKLLPKETLAEKNNLRLLEEEVLESMITEKIFESRARELNLSVSPKMLEERVNEIKKGYGDEFYNMLLKANIKYEQWKEELKKDMLFELLVDVDVNQKVSVSEAEAEDYFNENKEIYKEDAQVRVLHIVVRDLAKAQRALQRLNAGVDFAKVAAEESMGPEKVRGGDLGFIARQVMPEPLDNVIFSLPINGISQIVRSPYGFHVFKVIDIKPAKIKNFAESKEEVMAQLRRKKEKEAFIRWQEALKIKVVVKKESKVMREKVKR